MKELLKLLGYFVATAILVWVVGFLLLPYEVKTSNYTKILLFEWPACGIYHGSCLILALFWKYGDHSFGKD